MFGILDTGVQTLPKYLHSEHAMKARKQFSRLSLGGADELNQLAGHPAFQVIRCVDLDDLTPVHQGHSSASFGLIHIGRADHKRHALGDKGIREFPEIAA